jgi:transcriptional regulator with XRE-family HTH domain
MSRKKTQISELDLSTIGGRIAYIRLTNNLSQAQFAEKTGFSKGNVGGLETHKYEPSYKAITRLIELFKVEPNWLLFGETSQKTNENPEPLSQKQSVITEHQDIVRGFKRPEKAKEINEDLLILEEIDQEGFNEVHEIIKLKIERKKIFKKTRKIRRGPRKISSSTPKESANGN